MNNALPIQRAIEQVYWRHRIWPKENKTPKPSFDHVITDSFVQSKVEDYLKKSNAIAEYFKRPIKPEQLQAEMDRMVKNTKQPAITITVVDNISAGVEEAQRKI